MLAGGLDTIDASHSLKVSFPSGTLLVQLGGPGLLIGMGGGAASSMGAGANVADLDFDSVQRGNAEMQRRAQEVIDRCWQLGAANPILSIHDVGAGGLSNAVPEIAYAAGRGAALGLRAIPSEDSGMSPREIWCNEAQERYVLAVSPQQRKLWQDICARERCPVAILGTATADGKLVLDDPEFGNRPVDIPLAVVLGKPPKMLRDVRRLAPESRVLSLGGVSIQEATHRVMRHPAVANKSFLISIGDRTVGGLCSRDPCVGPWQVPVADCAVTLADFEGDAGESELILVDLGQGKNRLGGSILAQVFSQMGEDCPDLDSPLLLKNFFSTIQKLRPLILAYHDRSDGGLFAAASEMAFAGHCGVTLSLDAIAFVGAADDVDAFKNDGAEQLAGRSKDLALAALFNEELGALLQVRAADRGKLMQALREAGLGECSHVVGLVNPRDEIRVVMNNRPIYAHKRDHVQRRWSETSFQMATLRDNPDCAREEYDRIIEANDPGLSVQLTFEPRNFAVPKTARPKVAILREQGVNGQVEMAAAFDRAGFESVDVHMTDLHAGRVSLASFKGFAAGGGFSYGDVLGGGQGWAKSILFNPKVREEFEKFFARKDSFVLGACNGCQMLSALKELVPGAEAWPAFVRNRSEQFEARMVMVEIVKSPSILFAGMEGSRIPIVTAHGEGRAHFADQKQLSSALTCLRYVNNRGEVTDTYPYNPSGSPQGITGLTTADGRFTIVMPHPERVFRSVQMSWAPDNAPEDSPWMQIFRNARRCVG